MSVITSLTSFTSSLISAGAEDLPAFSRSENFWNISAVGMSAVSISLLMLSIFLAESHQLEALKTLLPPDPQAVASTEMTTESMSKRRTDISLIIDR